MFTFLILISHYPFKITYLLEIFLAFSISVSLISLGLDHMVYFMLVCFCFPFIKLERLLFGCAGF